MDYGDIVIKSAYSGIQQRQYISSMLNVKMQFLFCQERQL